MKIAIVTDNIYLKRKFSELLKIKELIVEPIYWSSSMAVIEAFDDVKIINIKEDWQLLIEFDIIFSLHSKSIFPNELVLKKRCINIHPGLNPFNRGWYPQIFSIINKLPVGVTIHEIDCELDHGPIIAQREIEIFEWDTSLSLYNRILEAEIEILDLHLQEIIDGNYNKANPASEGNLNFKIDFNRLCKIDLQQSATYGEVIDRLRALTHGDLKNAYFFDSRTGEKIYARIELFK
jgi:methionyl-tRNA formyltransferase